MSSRSTKRGRGEMSKVLLARGVSSLAKHFDALCRLRTMTPLSPDESRVALRNDRAVRRLDGARCTARSARVARNADARTDTTRRSDAASVDTFGWFEPRVAALAKSRAVARCD